MNKNSFLLIVLLILAASTIMAVKVSAQEQSPASETPISCDHSQDCESLWHTECFTIDAPQFGSSTAPCSLKVCILKANTMCHDVQRIKILSVEADPYCPQLVSVEQLSAELLYVVLNSFFHHTDPYDILPSGGPVKFNIYSSTCWAKAQCTIDGCSTGCTRTIYLPCSLEACCKVTFRGTRDGCGYLKGEYSKTSGSNSVCRDPNIAASSLEDDIDKIAKYYYPCITTPVFLEECGFSCGFGINNQSGIIYNDTMIPAGK